MIDYTLCKHATIEWLFARERAVIGAKEITGVGKRRK
jgi:hypothetical protein